METTNLLLNSLSQPDFALLVGGLRRAPIVRGDLVQRRGAAIDICFPEGGVLEVYGSGSGAIAQSIAVVGREGMTGWQVLLGCTISEHGVTASIGGTTGLWISATKLQAACGQSATLAPGLLRFVETVMVQMGRGMASIGADPVLRRLAAHLLRLHDRLNGDEIAVTHDQLGGALPARRASATDALHLLEGMGLIRSRRGSITIRDRAGLELSAGNAYGVAEACYRTLIGPFGKNVGQAAPTLSRPFNPFAMATAI